jgi:hypothetical protein
LKKKKLRNKQPEVHLTVYSSSTSDVRNFCNFLFMESLSEEGDYKVQVVVAKLELHPQSRKAKRKERQVVAWPCWQAAKGGRSFFRDHMGYAAVSVPP